MPDVSIEDVVCKHATQKAILVEVDGVEVWIPQSQITDSSEVWKEGDEGTLVITEWIATQKELL